LAPGDSLLDDLLEAGKSLELSLIQVTPDDTAIFQYTGGTTGTPKGALGTHRNLVANVMQFRHWLVDTQDGKETVLVAIPLFHVYGMVLGMLLAIYSGAMMVLIPNPRDFKSILESIQKYKVTIFPGVPTLYNAINNHPEVIQGKHDLSSIKACISGSAPLLAETKQRFESLTGGRLMEGYGLSEAPTATHCNPMQGENRSGSIGLPLPDVDARIVSLEDGMTVLKPNQVGELVLTGPQVMKGYHNLPVETRQILRDGWLYTGDIAYMDKDGYFYIIDRKKDLIKPGGYSVWPREVEEVIQTHPKVLEVSVAGVPDAYRGETVKAWVVLKPGETLDEAEIIQHCQPQLAAFKVPTQVEFRSELPKTLVGKVLRRELVRQHNESREG
jgi:long-chain acyl-CoA synthetase